MLYGFITDSAFVKINTGNLVPYTSLSAGLGVMTDQMVNYFMIPTTMVDPRSSSMIGSSNFRLQVSPFTSKLNGSIEIHFDEEKRYTLTTDSQFKVNVVYYTRHEVEGVVSFQAASVTVGAAVPAKTYYEMVDDLSQLVASTTKLNKFFNIVERIYLSQDETIEQLNAILVADTNAFAGYVDGSVNFSSVVTASPVKYLSGGDGNGVYSPSPLPTFKTWISFDYITPDTTEVITFKLWLDGSAFLADYEYSNIVKIVYPCDPARIITMDFDNRTAAIIASASYKAEQLAPFIKDEDHSGLETFTSRYTNNSVAGWYRLPFGILYKGRQPSFTQMRNAVRDDLLAKDIASIQVWKQVLPDLFADAAFYLVPIYSNRLQLPERYIDQNIINYDAILTKVQTLYPNVNITNIKTYGELLHASSAGLYIFAFPAIDNGEEFRSIKELHPTYQNIDAINNSGDADFESMDELTQDFNQTLSTCMSVALGTYHGTNPLTESSEDHKNYISFVSNYVEFHMLTQDSYY